MKYLKHNKLLRNSHKKTSTQNSYRTANNLIHIASDFLPLRKYKKICLMRQHTTRSSFSYSDIRYAP